MITISSAQGRVEDEILLTLHTQQDQRHQSCEDIEHVLCYFIICSNHPLITECQKITFQAFLSKYGFVIDFFRGNNIYLLLHCAG